MRSTSNWATVLFDGFGPYGDQDSINFCKTEMQ